MALSIDSLQFDLLAADPGTPAEGQMWYNTTDGKFKVYRGGATEVLLDVGSQGSIDHTQISNIGTNTHAQIDTHVASVVNPHSVTKTQVGLGNVTDDSQLKRAAGDIDSFTEKAVPTGGDWLLLEDSADTNNKKKVQIGNLPTGGGGEANTASNQGVAGVGFYDQKVGIDLQFRNLNVGSSKLSVTLDGANKEVDIDLVEGNVVHQNLSGAGTNTHAQIDTHVASVVNPHSVTNTQVGLGNVTNDAQLKRSANDFNTFANKGTAAAADVLLIEDAAASGAKKYITISAIPGAPPSSSITEATGSVTTTSATDVLVTSMSVTPAAGTYMAWFTGHATATANGQQVNVSLYSAGTQVASSERQCGFFRDSDTALPFTCIARVTVNGAQAIEGRWRTDTGTAGMTQRSIALIKVG